MCYLLNEVLNRQPIHSNFQFKEPSQKGVLLNEDMQITDEEAGREVEEPEREEIESDSFEGSTVLTKNPNSSSPSSTATTPRKWASET